MKFLQYLEKAWIMAAIAALAVMLYNLVTLRVFDYRVYFPLLCSGFCMLIWMNVKGQRKFYDKIQQDKRN